MLTLLHPGIPALAFFQSTQLNLFERFLNQAVSGINSTSITSGMQNIAYVILLIGFLWQVYQAALHGGDVRSLGTSLIKYVVTAVVVMNYTAVFTTVNQGFVNSGNWISNAAGATNLFENWKSDLVNQFNQEGTQKLWGLITADIPALLDGLLIIVAYILYPFVIAIFGFFYIFYGSVLYIFGPIVIALMPLGATNRIAKAYVENLFIWNSWPILYAGFGALLSAVQMGQISQMLGQNNFLGGFGNLEGSLLLGIASIIYSLAIAVIPFIAKRIVSGDVGSTAGALIGAAATALTAGAAAIEGATVGAAAASSGAGASSTTGSGARASSVSAGSSSTSTSATSTGNQPTPSQKGLDRPSAQSRAGQTSDHGGAGNTQDTPSGSAVREQSGGTSGGSQQGDATSGGSHEPTAEEHAEFMRGHLGAASSPNAASSPRPASSRDSGAGSAPGATASRTGGTGGRSSNAPARGSGGGNKPSMRRYDIGTWGAFHAARLATYGAISGGRATGGAVRKAADALAHPVEAAQKLGSFAGKTAGSVVNAAVNTARVAQSGLEAVSNPMETAQKGAQAVTGAASGVVDQAATTARDSVNAAKTGFSESYDAVRRGNEKRPQGKTEE
jgi:type IV secretory pathway TrbL component